MPYKDSFLSALFACYQRHSEPINIALITILAVIGRVFYSGAKLREAVGDLILCPLIVYAITPLVPQQIQGVNINPELIAVLAGIAGVHGIRCMSSWAIKRKIGIQLKSGAGAPK